MPIPDFQNHLVLVTGGAGFIGSHLVDGLLERGARVRVLDNFSTGRAENLSHCIGRLEVIEGDIRDLEICKRACQETSYLFHEAGLGSVPRSMKDPATTIAVNVGGTANVFSAARDARVRRLVYASSSSVYGDSPKLPKREGQEGKPLSPYALSKVMNEEFGDLFTRAFGMELIGLRYFNVYGPRQSPEGPYAAVIPRFFQAALKGQPPTIYGDGQQSRDFTYVSDAVLANLLAAGAAKEACGKAYNVGGGARISVNELASRIRSICGGRLEPVYEPSRAGDVRDSEADLSAVNGALGYEPQTRLADGLRQTSFSSAVPGDPQ